MRILVFQFFTRKEIASFDQGLDDGLVGVAPVALVVDDAAASKSRRFLGEETIVVDGAGNAGVEAFCFERGLVRHPNVEVVSAVARGSMDETGAGLVGDVIPV